MTGWTAEQSTAASKEGWDIFLAEGSMLNENGDRPYQLQRCDEADLFEDDDAAWRHVLAQAQKEGSLHQAAMNFLREHSRPEYDEIVEFNRQESGLSDPGAGR